jgi:hypothetical protein
MAINVPVLAFACVLSTAVAAGLGAFTAVRATSGDVREHLVEGARGQARSHGNLRIGRVIVASQMAITLVLVVGAGLLGRSLMKVLEVNPGFRVDKIVAMDVSLPWVEDPKAKTGQALFFANLIDRLGKIPGVRTVGATSGLPLDGGHPDGMFALLAPNDVPKTMKDLGALFQQKERLGIADFCVATNGFQALGIPLIRGRVFDARDGADAPHVAVITQALARDRWPNQDPIGWTIEFGNMDGDLRPLTIIGIVGDTHEYGLDAPARPTVYVKRTSCAPTRIPFQAKDRAGRLIVRTLHCPKHHFGEAKLQEFPARQLATLSTFRGYLARDRVEHVCLGVLELANAAGRILSFFDLLGAPPAPQVLSFL